MSQKSKKVVEKEIVTPVKEQKEEIKTEAKEEKLDTIIESFWSGYRAQTPKRIKIMDAYCLFLFLITGV